MNPFHIFAVLFNGTKFTLALSDDFLKMKEVSPDKEMVFIHIFFMTNALEIRQT